MLYEQKYTQHAGLLARWRKRRRDRKQLAQYAALCKAVKR